MVENCCPLSKIPLLRLQASLWRHFLPPDTALDIPQSSEQLQKDCFSAGRGLPEMPRGNVGNHLAGTNLVFGHQTASQGGIGLIMPSLPWKETSRTTDTYDSIRAEPMRLSLVATGVILSKP